MDRRRSTASSSSPSRRHQQQQQQQQQWFESDQNQDDHVPRGGNYQRDVARVITDDVSSSGRRIDDRESPSRIFSRSSASNIGFTSPAGSRTNRVGDYDNDNNEGDYEEDEEYLRYTEVLNSISGGKQAPNGGPPLQPKAVPQQKQQQKGNAGSRPNVGSMVPDEPPRDRSSRSSTVSTTKSTRGANSNNTAPTVQFDSSGCITASSRTPPSTPATITTNTQVMDPPEADGPPPVPILCHDGKVRHCLPTDKWAPNQESGSLALTTMTKLYIEAKMAFVKKLRETEKARTALLQQQRSQQKQAQRYRSPRESAAASKKRLRSPEEEGSGNSSSSRKRFRSSSHEEGNDSNRDSSMEAISSASSSVTRVAQYTDDEPVDSSMEDESIGSTDRFKSVRPPPGDSPSRSPSSSSGNGRRSPNAVSKISLNLEDFREMLERDKYNLATLGSVGAREVISTDNPWGRVQGFLVSYRSGITEKLFCSIIASHFNRYVGNPHNEMTLKNNRDQIEKLKKALSSRGGSNTGKEKFEILELYDSVKLTKVPFKMSIDGTGSISPYLERLFLERGLCCPWNADMVYEYRKSQLNPLRDLPELASKCLELADQAYACCMYEHTEECYADGTPKKMFNSVAHRIFSKAVSDYVMLIKTSPISAWTNKTSACNFGLPFVKDFALDVETKELVEETHKMVVSEDGIDSTRVSAVYSSGAKNCKADTSKDGNKTEQQKRGGPETQRSSDAAASARSRKTGFQDPAKPVAYGGMTKVA